MASSFDIIKVRLDSYEELTAFENKCFSNGEGIQFIARRPREFPLRNERKENYFRLAITTGLFRSSRENRIELGVWRNKIIIMENYRNAVQKIFKLKELGVFDKWVFNTDNRTKDFGSTNPIKQELNCVQRRNRLLATYPYLSDMIEASLIFSDCPEGRQFWYDILDSLRSEI